MSTRAWRKRYADHLLSPYWADLKRSVVFVCGNKCEHCNRDGRLVQLELHHRHYRTLGREALGDVELLCAGCHEKADKARATEGRARQARGARVRFENGLRTFVRKKYGNVPSISDDMVADFTAWLERKRAG